MDLNIVVGCSGLIGSSISKLLCENENYENILIDRVKHADLPTFELNVMDYVAVDRFFESAAWGEYGKVTLIYLSALDMKLGNAWRKFEDFDPQYWRNMSSVNQEALLYFISRFIKLRNKKYLTKPAQIILFPSLYNYTGPDHSLYDENMTVQKPFEYIGTKSLCRDLLRYINVTYGKQGLRANAVVPHLVVKEEYDIPVSLIKRTVTGRIIKPIDVAQLVEFFIESPANVIGQELKIDGGWLQK